MILFEFYCYFLKKSQNQPSVLKPTWPRKPNPSTKLWMLPFCLNTKNLALFPLSTQTHHATATHWPKTHSHINEIPTTHCHRIPTAIATTVPHHRSPYNPDQPITQTITNPDQPINPHHKLRSIPPTTAKPMLLLPSTREGTIISTRELDLSLGEKRETHPSLIPDSSLGCSIRRKRILLKFLRTWVKEWWVMQAWLSDGGSGHGGLEEMIEQNNREKGEWWNEREKRWETEEREKKR